MVIGLFIELTEFYDRNVLKCLENKKKQVVWFDWQVKPEPRDSLLPAWKKAEMKQNS